jgi:hypothetical protein
VAGHRRAEPVRRRQPRVPGEPEPLIAETFGTDFVRDPLNPAVFGGLNADAVRLMDEVGYE